MPEMKLYQCNHFSVMYCSLPEWNLQYLCVNIHQKVIEKCRVRNEANLFLPLGTLPGGNACGFSFVHWTQQRVRGLLCEQQLTCMSMSATERFLYPLPSLTLSPLISTRWQHYIKCCHLEEIRGGDKVNWGGYKIHMLSPDGSTS